MSPPQKVSLYSANDLKNATDDALAPYLTTLPKPYTFTQQHYLTNIRLALGYTAVIIAGGLFYADYKLGWDATKAYTAPACVAYFILNGALTFWTWAVEGGTIFVGIREGGQKLTIKSSMQKYKPTYKLKVTYEAPSGIKWEDKEFEGAFTQWFNTQGYLQTKELRAWLAQNIEVLGLAEKETRGNSLNNQPASIPMRADETMEHPSATPSFPTGIETSAIPASAKKGRKKKKA
ncbi:uncharacterized protein Z518_09070 [Rhinocladiella mackenziei CBS 650.93]|uniref:Signal peptidase complex subunit 2 n=1 Tax=Rhinocladiella mackenziei CBS 650.93 TaxID=1442369 RepID=A0A0D2IXM5_9EURO|nr:uncharacterized protein Z518_09070 [Rhinocladiella mackenziei CBS 650.93]KIX01345.1 hypothetical protein Z518_09070 [Rhinocladiella mackenziei CBS 650.93]